MPLSQKVTIRYGPYESCGVVDYRTSRLIGLKTMLEDNGHSWVEEQSPDWNIVELVVNGEVVFTCNITDLDFVCLSMASSTVKMKPHSGWRNNTLYTGWAASNLMA
ncbi:UPF0728 protein C10orf53 homolog isoform X2 [Hypanus sabinus]|uniref:UPF0728 protein C10orf53 homolog isoform X2 n=1 Tax=Hypanus sabinus TaxID=79690 RepID=UPI0028C48323|nr:UPF0728 protein C10orf53 homolog isoform X2 [Hypanus sabinus]